MDSVESEGALSSFGFGQALQQYAFAWVFNFFVTTFGAIVANGIFSVPLYQVVNVNLSIAIFVMLVLLAIYGVGFVFALVSMNFSAVVVLLFGSVLAILIPFAPIAAFQIYAYFGSLSVGGESFIYDGFMESFAVAAKFLASATGQLTIEVPLDPAGPKKILFFGMSLETLSQASGVAGFLLALTRVFMGRGERRRA